MASLGMMLAGSAIGQGSANFVHGQMQGDMDRERLGMTQASNAFQQKQMDRTLGQQQIEDQPVDGATDEDRLNQLADIAGQHGRGDLQRKYQSQAREARQNLQMTNIANASKAITLGQFEPAAQMLNKAGIFGSIHSIALADDVEQDPRNPTYSVYTGGAPDEGGNPAQGPHVHVNQQMLYQLQAKPADALHWMTQAQNYAQQNDIRQQRVDQTDTKLAEVARHNKATEAWHRLSAGKSGSGHASNEQSRLQWALTQIGKPDGFKNEMEARMWATDPQRNNKDYWQSMKIGTEVSKSGGMFSADDIKKIAEAFKASPIGTPAPAAPAGGGGGAAGTVPPNHLKTLGLTPVPGREKEGAYADSKGRNFKQDGNKILQWSNSGKKWVDVTAAILDATR